MDITHEKLQEMTKGILYDEDSPEIEGCIYKTEQGEWVTIVLTMEGRLLRLRTGYCMFCGAYIHGKDTHKCGE